MLLASCSQKQIIEGKGIVRIKLEHTRKKRAYFGTVKAKESVVDYLPPRESTKYNKFNYNH